jgi:hypothetical protein
VGLLLAILVTWSSTTAMAADGLVGLWRFDNPNDLGADSSGTGNNLVVEGGVSYDPDGRFEGAGDFDGIDGALLPADGFPSDIPIGDDSYTIAAWIRPTAPLNDSGYPTGMVGWGTYGVATSVNAFRILGDNGFRHYWWGADLDAQDFDVELLDIDLDDGQWHHAVALYDGVVRAIYLDGEFLIDDEPAGNDAQPEDFAVGRTCSEGADRPWCGPGEFFYGQLDDVAIFNVALDETQIAAIMDGDFSQFGVTGEMLMPGDANMDLEFNQLDIVQVQISAKYLTGQPATWGEGDWNGAPGGSPGSPPLGNGQFDQLDIVAALSGGVYLTGPYASVATGGSPGDAQTSIVYNQTTGEIGVDPPLGVELTSINIESAAGIFTGAPAENLGGSFDNDADDNIFKATFGGTFGAISFGSVAQTGLSEQFVASDLTVVGSLAGGGDLGDVDLVFVPEPTTLFLLAVGLGLVWGGARRRRSDG